MKCMRYISIFCLVCMCIVHVWKLLLFETLNIFAFYARNILSLRCVIFFCSSVLLLLLLLFLLYFYVRKEICLALLGNSSSMHPTILYLDGMSVCMCAFMLVYVYALAYENHAFYMNVLVLLLLNIIVFAGRYFVTVVALTVQISHLLSISLPSSRFAYVLSSFHSFCLFHFALYLIHFFSLSRRTLSFGVYV